MLAFAMTFRPAAYHVIHMGLGEKTASLSHTHSMASYRSFTPALVRDVIMQVGHSHVLFYDVTSWNYRMAGKFSGNLIWRILIWRFCIASNDVTRNCHATYTYESRYVQT